MCAVEIICFAKEQRSLISKAQRKHEYFRSFPRVPTQWMSVLVQMKGFLNLFYRLSSPLPWLEQARSSIICHMHDFCGGTGEKSCDTAPGAGAGQVFIAECTRAGVWYGVGSACGETFLQTEMAE